VTDDEEDGEEESWEGIDEAGENKATATIAIAAPEGHVDEYIDEDRYATVKVEPMNLNSDDEEKDDDAASQEGSDKEDETADGDRKDGNSTKKRIWTKNKPAGSKAKPKPKKTKFRYETKSERKSNRTRQSLKNKAAARSRKGED